MRLRSSRTATSAMDSDKRARAFMICVSSLMHALTYKLMHTLNQRTAIGNQGKPPVSSPGSPGAECETAAGSQDRQPLRSEEHTSELQSLMRNTYAVFCLKKKKKQAS